MCKLQIFYIYLFNKWTGPARIVDVRSPYSYTVEIEDGSRRIFHANKLRKFNVCVESVICDSLIEELEPLTPMKSRHAYYT